MFFDEKTYPNPLLKYCTLLMNIQELSEKEKSRSKISSDFIPRRTRYPKKTTKESAFYGYPDQILAYFTENHGKLERLGIYLTLGLKWTVFTILKSVCSTAVAGQNTINMQ